jgi:hypothetical protein
MSTEFEIEAQTTTSPGSSSRITDGAGGDDGEVEILVVQCHRAET